MHCFFISDFLHSIVMAHLIPLVLELVFFSKHIGGAALSQYFLTDIKREGCSGLLRMLFTSPSGWPSVALNLAPQKSSQGGIASADALF